MRQEIQIQKRIFAFLNIQVHRLKTQLLTCDHSSFLQTDASSHCLIFPIRSTRCMYCCNLNFNLKIKARPFNIKLRAKIGQRTNQQLIASSGKVGIPTYSYTKQNSWHESGPRPKGRHPILLQAHA